MKLFVNGVEVDQDPSGVEIQRLPDRLVVRTDRGAETAVAVRAGDSVLVSFRGQQYRVDRKRPRSGSHGPAASGEIRAPMPGQIVDVLVAEGDAVKLGEKLLVLEAMKTQQAFTAAFDGVVSKIGVRAGEQVVEGALLVVVEPEGETP